MSRTRLAPALVGGGLIFLSLWVTACDTHAPAAGPPASAPATTQPAMVAVSTVAARVLPLRIPIVGTLDAAEEVIVSTKVRGILERTYLDVGAVVRPGTALASVDPFDYAATVKQAQAGLTETLARLGTEAVPDADFDLTKVSSVQRAAAQLENARFSHDRLVSLNDAVSGQELSDAEALLRVATAGYQIALDEARALVATAHQRQAQLALAQRALEDAQVVGPPIPTTLSAGAADHWVVAERLATEGRYLDVADQLYRLVICDPLKLRSSVPERYAADVAVGQEVTLASTEGSRDLVGQITRITPAVDPATRTFQIEALLKNEGDRLKPGAFVTGEITSSRGKPALCVPRTALVTTGGATRVFIVSAGVVRRQDVRVGRALDEIVEITAGLTDGQQVVTSDLDMLRDGDPVQARSGS